MQELSINISYRFLGRNCVAFTDVEADGWIPNAPLQKQKCHTVEG